MTDMRHSRRCWCDGCARARTYMARSFPDPEVLFRAIGRVWDADDPDDTHAHTQALISAYKEEMAAAS